MHLWHAAERIWVLNVRFRLFKDFTACEQLAHAFSCFDLTFVGTHLVNRIGEWLNKAIIGVERHCSYLISPVVKSMALNQCPYGKRAHILRAVEQRKTFFRSKFYRFPAHGLQHLFATHHFALILHFAETNQWQRKVCKWHEVARCAKRALLIYYRIDVIIKEIYKSFHSIEFAARIAVAQGLNLEQKHNFHYFVGHTLACAASVRHHQVDLQLCQMVVTYRYVAERAETGGYAIHWFCVGGNFLIEVFTAMHYALASVVAEL